MVKATGLCYNKVALEQGRRHKTKYLPIALFFRIFWNFYLVQTRM